MKVPAAETPSVGIREFRATLAEYIDADTPVTVTRHGQAVGLFVPLRRPSADDLLRLKTATANFRKAMPLTDDEVEKTKQLARGDLVQAFETVSSAAMRLGRDAGVGQAAEREAVLAKAMAAATKSDLAKLAATYIDAKDAVVVIVGPRAQIEPQLKSAGIEGTIEAAGPEGQ